MPRGELKHRCSFFADTPKVTWTVSVIWKDLLWRADLYRLLKYREDIQYRCFIWVYDVKSTEQPDTIAFLGNNFRLQIIETWFAEQFYVSHRMGPAPICLKISARIAERETYRMTTENTPLFSLVNTFKAKTVSFNHCNCVLFLQMEAWTQPAGRRAGTGSVQNRSGIR